MNKKNVTVTLILQVACWIVIAWILAEKLDNTGQAHAASAIFQSTPQPFLGPIYYGRRDVLNVFDHDLPCATVCEDVNDDVLHHNGMNMAVTETPDPSHTATPEGWPPPTPYIPAGFGYDEHGGVDYLLKYVPVIAAANGNVLVADWADPSNHRGSFGLHVQLEHGTYTTLYAHLSVVTVEQGVSVTADPSDRNSIIGISGNTGSVLGGCPDVGSDPLCSAHLHFEVREGSGYKPVNPYDWTAPIETVDPWSVYINPQGTPAGAVSYNLWATPPALVSSADQYPGTNVPPVSEPAVNNARMIIDDGSADFSMIDTCWVYTPGNDSYNNSYRRANPNGPNNCRARWTINPDAFTPPGEYDVFVHIPEDATASLGAVYMVNHNSETSRAIVVQAAYLDNNTEHGAWAYLGRYDFAMDTAVSEFVELNDVTLSDDAGNHVLADAVMLAPAAATTSPVNFLYVSFSGSGYAGNVAYADEDVLLFDAHTGEWQMFFDGSNMGFANVDVDAFAFQDGSLYFSIDNPSGGFDDSDIIRFAPTAFGENTSGTLSLFKSGATLGLTTNAEDVDAISFNDQGYLLLSTLGQAVIYGNMYEDEDLFVTEGSEKATSMFFDGSTKELNANSEDIDGVWQASNHIYLSTEGDFMVSGSGTSGDGADVFVCSPGFTEECLYVPGLLWNGSAHGMGTTATLDDFFVHDNHLLDDCETFGNGGFEGQFYCWTVSPASDPAAGRWQISTVEKHTGTSSAEMRVDEFGSTQDDTYLISSHSEVVMDQAYRVSFWGKGVPDIPSGNIYVEAEIWWYTNNEIVRQTWDIVNILEHQIWMPFDSGCMYPPSPNVDYAKLVFRSNTITLMLDAPLNGSGSIFIDDVVWEIDPSCPIIGQN